MTELPILREIFLENRFEAWRAYDLRSFPPASEAPCNPARDRGDHWLNQKWNGQERGDESGIWPCSENESSPRNRRNPHFCSGEQAAPHPLMWMQTVARIE
jgi:hypothetical protein